MESLIEKTHETKAMQLMLQAVEDCFDSGATRFDDITLANSYVQFVTEVDHSQNDIDYSATISTLINLITRLSQAYQMHKYGAK